MTKQKFLTCKNSTNLAGATTHMRSSVRGKKKITFLNQKKLPLTLLLM